MATMPCICPLSPIAVMPRLSTRAMTALIDRATAAHQSSGFCSAHPCCGVEKAYSSDSLSITIQLSSRTIVLQVVVPQIYCQNH